MMDYILDYMGKKGVYASSWQEQEKLEQGIARYLLENGIDMDETRDYHKSYVFRHLEIIDLRDLKLYFMHYPLLSEINQIVIEYRNDGRLSDAQKEKLYFIMEHLYRCGLKEKYIPVDEVRKMI